MPAAEDALVYVAGLPGVADAVAAARRAVDALRGHRVLRQGAQVVAAESALRGARASSVLEGLEVPLAALRGTVAAGGALPAGTHPVVRGALRVAAEAGQLQGAWGRAPLQVLARLHTLAAADLVAAEEELGSLGRPRAVASARLGALGEALTTTTGAPALVVAAVVHAEVATMGAFPQGAGVVARAASRLTLVSRGLDPAGVSVPEVGHLELGREAYREALGRYAGGGPEGIAAWVAHCAEAVVLGAREGVAVCESFQRGALRRPH